MWVIALCVVMVLAGLVAIARWGGLAVQPPPSWATGSRPACLPVRPLVGLVVRRYLWYLTPAISARRRRRPAGRRCRRAGGHAARRFRPGAAQGSIIEADQVVGRISVDGTIGFIVFTGVHFGARTVRRLPAPAASLAPGRAGRRRRLRRPAPGPGRDPAGAPCAWAGEPGLRPGGPGTLSLVTFAALVLFHGMLVAALAGMPLGPAGAPTALAVAAHLPLLLLAGSARSPWSQPSWAPSPCWPARSPTGGRRLVDQRALDSRARGPGRRPGGHSGPASAAVSILGRPWRWAGTARANWAKWREP